MKDKPLDYGTLKISIEMSMLKITGIALVGKDKAKEVAEYILRHLDEIKEDK